jgi:hypothetical protein
MTRRQLDHQPDKRRAVGLLREAFGLSASPHAAPARAPLSPEWGRGLNTRNAATARTVIVTPGARRCSGRTPLEGCDEWRVPRRATQGFGGMAMQSPNPQASPLSSWDVYRQAHKAIWLGTVEATDERDAIEKVAKERNIPAKRLIATRHR